MANQAEKKRLKGSKALQGNLVIVGGGITVVFLLCHLVWFGTQIDKSFISSVLFHTLLSLFCCKNMISSAREGYSYNYYLDTAGLNWAVQLLSLYSDKAWYLFLLIPGYLIYKFGGYIWGWVFKQSPSDIPDPDEEARLAKKQRKMERKQARGGVVKR
mmetsp:Transcript_3200/g.4611  ORF Transcript_3200/g.4611 Transcript_3200/m.4611 type:complete len:158 (+) Transcript_3200:297-770(+)